MDCRQFDICFPSLNQVPTDVTAGWAASPVDTRPSWVEWSNTCTHYTYAHTHASTHIQTHIHTHTHTTTHILLISLDITKMVVVTNAVRQKPHHSLK